VTTAVDFTNTTIKNLDGNTVQTGDSFARIGATGSGLTSVAAASTAVSNADYTAARAAKLDDLDATISSRSPASTALSTAQWTNGRATNLDSLDATVSSRATPAQVNTEVVDALAVDTYAEPGQEAPAATNTLAVKIGYTFKAWRNKSDQTNALYRLYADDATTVDNKATVSDDGTMFSRNEVGSGP